MKKLLLNKDVITVNQQTSPPGDVVGEILGSDPGGGDKVQIWTRELTNLPSAVNSVGLAVAAVNFANTTRTVSIPWSMLDSQRSVHWGGKKVRVDDLWEHTAKDVTATGSLKVTVQPHDTKLLQVTLPPKN